MSATRSAATQTLDVAVAALEDLDRLDTDPKEEEADPACVLARLGSRQSGGGREGGSRYGAGSGGSGTLLLRTLARGCSEQLVDRHGGVDTASEGELRCFLSSEVQRRQKVEYARRVVLQHREPIRQISHKMESRLTTHS